MPYKDKDKNREYQRIHSREKRARFRLLAIAILGGKCIICGYDENHRALQIDHIEPILRKGGNKNTLKEYYKIVNGTTDISKLQLLCANCHAIKTFEDRISFSNYIS